MLVFDVDGVVSDPWTTAVEPSILKHILQRLERHEPVAFNTGRSLDWMTKKIINPLASMIKNPKNLSNMMVVSEKGGIEVTFDKDGQMLMRKNESVSAPDLLRESVKKLIQAKYSKIVFFDEPLQTMISAEMVKGTSQEEYREQEAALGNDMALLIKGLGLDSEFKVDQATNSQDIINKRVGKDFAAGIIIEWLQARGIQPESFTAFGDNPEDIKMADRLHENGFPVKFVYVGTRKLPKGRPFEIISMEGKFTKGTLDFLNSLPR